MPDINAAPHDVEIVQFLPLHKRAFGMATGLAASLIVFGATAMTLLFDAGAESPIGLLSQYFTGYTVSWTGAFVGAAWGAFSGFVMGWFLAFSRNAFVALMILYVRTRADWSQKRDFLDHI